MNTLNVINILFFHLISHQIFGAAKVNSITTSQVMILLTVKQYINTFVLATFSLLR